MASKSKNHSYLISTTSIALVLFLLGAVTYIGYIVKKGTDAVVGDIKLTLILDEKCQQSDAEKLIKEIESDKIAMGATYLSKEEAAEEYKSFSGEDFTMFIEENPLPSSITVVIDQQFDTPHKIDSLSGALSKKIHVEEVLHPKGVFDQVLGYIYKIKLVLYSFGFVLLLISIVLINNAIKLTIRSKRFLIKSMKLIGASDGFIIGPFIWRAVGQGLMASFTAILILLLLFIGVNRGFSGIAYMKEDMTALLLVFAMMVALGVLLTVICTAIALKKEINQNINKLHTY